MYKLKYCTVAVTNMKLPSAVAIINSSFRILPVQFWIFNLKFHRFKWINKNILRIALEKFKLNSLISSINFILCFYFRKSFFLLFCWGVKTLANKYLFFVLESFYCEVSGAIKWHENALKCKKIIIFHIIQHGKLVGWHYLCLLHLWLIFSRI